MNNNETTLLQQRKRKMLLLLPVIVLPFLTLLFWSMKSKDSGNETARTVPVPGLNMHLPDAKLKDTGSADKLNYYEQADAEARKLNQQRQQDPYARNTRDAAAQVAD